VASRSFEVNFTKNYTLLYLLPLPLYRCWEDSVCASFWRLEKTVRTSSYHTAQDCTEWPEIPQPHTDWGTWCGSERLTLKAVGDIQHYTL